MEFTQIFNELMNTRGLTAYRLARETGISEMTIGRWRSGKALPSGENLATLSEYFNVTTDYLLGIKMSDDALDSLCRTAGISRTFLSLAQEAEDAGIDPTDFRNILQTVASIKAEYRDRKKRQKRES